LVRERERKKTDVGVTFYYYI